MGKKSRRAGQLTSTRLIIVKFLQRSSFKGKVIALLDSRIIKKIFRSSQCFLTGLKINGIKSLEKLRNILELRCIVI